MEIDTQTASNSEGEMQVRIKYRIMGYGERSTPMTRRSRSIGELNVLSPSRPHLTPTQLLSHPHVTPTQLLSHTHLTPTQPLRHSHPIPRLHPSSYSHFLPVTLPNPTPPPPPSPTSPPALPYHPPSPFSFRPPSTASTMLSL